jgi:carboxylesterase
MSRLKRILNTKATTRLYPEARAYRNSPTGAKEAFLLCHGFTGTPRELSKVGDALATMGIASYAPRYPGHGTDRADFYATSAEDWLRCAIDGYLELRSEYETVNVIGHSMGGLIATIAAASFNAPCLILLAPAFKVSNSALPISPALALVAPVIKRHKKNEETDSFRKQLFEAYWSDDLVAQAAQLRRLQKAARRDLARVHSKTLVVTGDKDDTVPSSVTSYLEKRALGVASFESHSIAGVGHLFPFDQGSAEACAIIKDWVGKDAY